VQNRVTGKLETELIPHTIKVRVRAIGAIVTRHNAACRWRCVSSTARGS
jgi:hypothetical protein